MRDEKTMPRETDQHAGRSLHYPPHAGDLSHPVSDKSKSYLRLSRIAADKTRSDWLIASKQNFIQNFKVKYWWDVKSSTIVIFFKNLELLLKRAFKNVYLRFYALTIWVELQLHGNWPISGKVIIWRSL